MTEPERVGPREAFDKVSSDAALLVCAYDSDERFQALRLEGAISLHELRSKLDSLPKDREIVFYCA
jgi:rhodanese-related sulfurtransferase